MAGDMACVDASSGAANAGRVVMPGVVGSWHKSCMPKGGKEGGLFLEDFVRAQSMRLGVEG